METIVPNTPTTKEEFEVAYRYWCDNDIIKYQLAGVQVVVH